MKKVFLVFLCLFSTLAGYAQIDKERWVDSVFQTLSPEDKIGQIVVVPLSIKKGENEWQRVESQIQNFGLGGLIITDGGPIMTATKINEFQRTSKIPVLIAVNTDGGLANVLDSIIVFPAATILDAVDNDSLKKSLQTVISRQTKTIGAHVSMSESSTHVENLSVIDFQKIQTGPKNKRYTDLVKAVFEGSGDLIVNSKDVRTFIKRSKKLIAKNPAWQVRLNTSVRRILALKYELGLNKQKLTDTDNLIERLNTSPDFVLRQALYESAVTVVKDNNTLPIKILDNKKFAILTVSGRGSKTFSRYISKYQSSTHFSMESLSDTARITNELSLHDLIIVALYPQSENIQKQIIKWLRKETIGKDVIIVNFGDGQLLAPWSDFPVLIQSYSDEDLMQMATAEVIFGALPAKGKLPPSLSSVFEQAANIKTSSLQRLKFSLPEEAGMDSKTLSKIKSIVYEAIENKATPGCYVLVAKDGKIVYDHAYGWQTYENKIPVDENTIYDLASITKVSATLQAVSFLYEKGMINLNKKASVYLPELLNTNKKDIILKDILTHQSGLFPFLLLYPQTMKDSVVLPEFYSSKQSTDYPMQIAPGLFGSPLLRDSIWQWILKSKMIEKPVRTPYPYRYSDLGFMILERMAERLLNQSVEDFLRQNIYEPLGANTLGFTPLQRFPESQIAPTEIDRYFRKSTLTGTVHDERAAMLGGFAGHAGLFGNANDLLKLGQMWLQQGTYGGLQFYKPETVQLFTQKQFENSKRGLGWAKAGDPNSPSSRFGSSRMFGHTGFTGTCLWVDPEFNLVFVFLSNRVYPDRSTKLLTTNIRSRIQDVVYESIFEYCKSNQN
ncbi:MAG: serine hydrolase [Flammeovirgaceae bacterium]|nr:serine hydrolase [Flammeovirgaceae bacterium]